MHFSIKWISGRKKNLCSTSDPVLEKEAAITGANKAL